MIALCKIIDFMMQVVAKSVVMKGDGEFVAEAHKIIAKKFLGKGRLVEMMAAADRKEQLGALGATSLEDDDELLASGKVMKSDKRSVLEYSIGTKKALKELM